MDKSLELNCSAVSRIYPFSNNEACGVLNRLGLLIWCFYVFGSYYVLYNEKKRKLIPQYIKLTPTVISIVTGLIIASFTYYLMDGLGYAIGLLFADYYMFRRLSYIDPETGFFNEKYIAVLEKEAKKQNIHYEPEIQIQTIRKTW